MKPVKTVLVTDLDNTLYDTVSRRPQLQERLTSQIADALCGALLPKGVMVLVEAEHMCMSMRGVRSPGSTTLTAVARGVLESTSELRAEAFKLLRSRP